MEGVAGSDQAKNGVADGRAADEEPGEGRETPERTRGRRDEHVCLGEKLEVVARRRGRRLW